MIKKPLTVQVTDEEAEILMYALRLVMAAKVPGLSDRGLSDIHFKLAAAQREVK